MSAAKEDLWVLEWHQESNNIHIQPLCALVGLNRTRFVINAPVPGRYVPIFIGTRKEVEREVDKIRPTLIERQKEREAA